MIAKIMATLGLDGSKFHAGIDSANAKTKQWQVSLRSLNKMAMVAFGGAMVGRLLSSIKELRSYQERTGLNIVSTEDLNQIDAATSSIEKLKMQMVGIAAEGMSTFIQGIKAAAAGLGDYTGQVSASEGKLKSYLKLVMAFQAGGISEAWRTYQKDVENYDAEQNRQAMAGATELGPSKDAATKKEIAEHNAKMQRTYLEAQREQMTDAEKLVSLEKELADARSKQQSAMIGASEVTKDDLKRLETVAALEKEVARAKQAAAEEAKKAAQEAEKRAKEEREAAEDLSNARAKLSSMNERDATTFGRLKQAYAEALAKVKIAEDAAADKSLTGTDKTKADMRVVEAKTDLREAQDAYRQYEKTQRDKESENGKKETEIREGKDKDLPALTPGLNQLSSIGGYVGNTKAAAAIGMKDRSLEVQENIDKNTAEMNEALQRLAGGDE